jgi:hypothetical protein
MEFGLGQGLVFNGVRLPDFAICGQEIISRSPKKNRNPLSRRHSNAAEIPPNADISCLKSADQKTGCRICAKIKRDDARSPARFLNLAEVKSG